MPFLVMKKLNKLFLLIPALLSLLGCDQTIIHTPGDDLIIVMNEMLQEYGECFIIKYGDFEIVVDSGTGRENSLIKSNLNKYVSDKTIDLMVMTHPHGDHINGFNNGLFNGFNVDTLVDFGYTYVTNGDDEISSPYIYNQYINVRNSLINKGTKYYPITQILKNKVTYISKKDYIGIEWLKNDFYVDYGKTFPNDSIPNNNPNITSVAFNLFYKNWNFVFAGDADSTFAETTIIKNHQKIFNGKNERVALKATHHASSSSLGGNFLDWSKAETIFCSAAMIDEVSAPNNVVLGSGYGEQNHPNRSTVRRIRNHLEGLNSNQFYWNGINGTSIFTCDGVNDLTFSGEGRSKNYYKKNTNELADVQLEKNVTFFDSEFSKYF